MIPNLPNCYLGKVCCDTFIVYVYIKLLAYVQIKIIIEYTNYTYDV
jgi:hypothetical protein